MARAQSLAFYFDYARHQWFNFNEDTSIGITGDGDMYYLGTNHSGMAGLGETGTLDIMMPA